MSQTDNEAIQIGDHVTIRRRGKKRTWTADFTQDGAHCRQSLKTSNIKFAKERARRLDLEIAEGMFPGRRKKPVKMPLLQAIDEYELFLKSESRQPKTLVKVKGILARKFAPFAASVGVIHLQDVTLRLIDQFRAKRSTEIGERSMHNDGSALKTFLGWCAERDLIAVNPLGTRKFRRPKQKPIGGPTLEQVNQVLANCPAIRLAPLAFTGMRAGECQRLRPDDVDFRGNWIHIVTRRGLKTKTGDSWKDPIHSRLRQILQQVPKGQREWFFTALPSPRYPAGGHHLNMKHVCEDFKKVLRQLGIPVGKKNGGFTLHSLRSSFKIICIHAGIPREVVDAWQNHAGQRPTASDAYYKLSDEESQRFMLEKAPFRVANSPGDGENHGGA
jgi:integrase